MVLVEVLVDVTLLKVEKEDTKVLTEGVLLLMKEALVPQCLVLVLVQAVVLMILVTAVVALVVVNKVEEAEVEI